MEGVGQPRVEVERGRLAKEMWCRVTEEGVRGVRASEWVSDQCHGEAAPVKGPE